MSYKKWNEILVKHFIENADKEIILYIDDAVINEIGTPHNLDFNNFFDSVLVNVETRYAIFDSIINSPKRDVPINRKISGNIMNMPWVLTNPFDLTNPKVNSRCDLPFFNFIALAVVTMSQNVREPKNPNASFYVKLNEIINSKLPDNPRVTTLDKFDELFLEIEKYTNKRFKNRKIGTNRYVGLLKYQVVLTPKEKKEFEKLMYENQLVINDDFLYTELANKLFQIIPNNSTLRDKVKKGSEDRCYGDWFLNQAINFNRDEYLRNLSDQDKENIRIKKTANFALAFDDVEKVLKLLTDLPGEQKVENGVYSFYTDLERVEDNFSVYPVMVKSTEKIEFKEYAEINSDSFKISPIPIKDVNFFQKTNYGFYKQTLTTRENYDTIIVVKSDKNIIEKWEKWIKEEGNIEGVSEKIVNETTSEIFGENWVVYKCDGSIKKSYYRNNENFIGNINYRGDDIDLEIRAVGGYKIKKLEKTYVDVALPSFVIDFPNFESKYLSIVVKRDVLIDRCFKPIINKNFVQISVDDDLHIDQDSHIEVFFRYDGDKKKYEKDFEFSFKTSLFPKIDESSLYKLNAWGEKLNDNKKYYNGITILNAENIGLSNTRHKLSDLKESRREFSDYFIHLLVGAFNINDDYEINSVTLNEIIENTFAFLRNNDIEVSINEYSKFNLIKNLIALGYINKDTENNITKFQLNAPTLRKVECAFEIGGHQIYKLIGARTKYFTQKFKQYFEEKGILLKYRGVSIDKLDMAEYALLPDIIFVSGNLNTNCLTTFLNGNNLSIRIEDNNNLGDSLLNYIAPVSDFENKFLHIEPQNFTEAFFEPINSNTFPRIRIDLNRTGNFGNFKHKRLEVKQGKFYSNLPIDWMENYVSFKHKLPVMMMRNPARNGNEHNLYPDIYFYKYNRLPFMVFKALVEINNGLPCEKKIFYVDNDWNSTDLNYSYSVFYKFNVSSNQERRKKLIRILTGNESYLNNDQIVITNNESSNYHMTYHYSHKMNSNFITIMKSEMIIALIKIMPYNIYHVYVNKECVEVIKDDSSKIEINSVQYSMVRIELIENINNSISLILKNKFDDFEINNEITKDLKYESVRSEEILIEQKI